MKFDCSESSAQKFEELELKVGSSKQHFHWAVSLTKAIPQHPDLHSQRPFDGNS